MISVSLSDPTDFGGWRKAARALRLADVPPEEVRWRVGDAGGEALFDGPPPPDPPPGAGFTVSKAFMDLAKIVILHRDGDRFTRLYRLLWRLKDEPRLLDIVTDPDVAEALVMHKNVRQAEHKMHAFVRFRRVDAPPDPATEEYAAWYEPPHYVIELGAGFFVRRLANVRFSIVSPYVSVRWDGAALKPGPPGEKADVPAEDASEENWKTYFANVFNPARLNTRMMTKEMPKHYWQNLPEAQLIPSLVQGAQGRTETMVQALPSEPSSRALKAAVRAQRNEPVDGGLAVSTLEEVRAGVQVCRRCDLWRDATQGVPGEGPRSARLMFVGEQPGDQEDLAGKPFVGPAGKLFNQALEEAGVPRGETYVTNSVKHFKHELRGKRRIHAKPNQGEVTACNWWLSQERRIVRPRVVVALGATASMAVFKKSHSVLRERGVIGELGDGALGFLTVHPSFLLRVQDDDAKEREFALFVRDLKAAWALVE